jgi:hypothetical protein
LKIITACAAAALVVGSLSLTSGGRSQVETITPTSAPNSVGKGDRLDIDARGAACSRRILPHYDIACRYDGMRPAGEVHEVRLPSADRLSTAE